MASKLSLEEKEDLLSLIGHRGWRALTKELHSVSEAISADVLKCDLSNTDEKELIRRKLRAEGAEKLVATFLKRLEQTSKNE